MEPSWQTCIHQADGLCPDCLEEFEADPGAWIEFGRHTLGIANWEHLQAEMTQAAELPSVQLSPEEMAGIPF